MSRLRWERLSVHQMNVLRRMLDGYRLVWGAERDYLEKPAKDRRGAMVQRIPVLGQTTRSLVRRRLIQEDVFARCYALTASGREAATSG